MKGTVIWFNRQRGYGFVHGEDDKDYFAHQMHVEGANRKDRNLFANQEVVFDIGVQEDGRELADHIVPGERPPKEEKEVESASA